MNTRQWLTEWVEEIWYGSRPLERTLLWPLSVLFSTLSQYRRRRLSQRQQPHQVPVIIIGNISVGGTGKTPLTIRLAQLLRAQGYHPGIVSRGYGARSSDSTAVDALEEKAGIKSVSYDSRAEEVGDEALLMAVRTGLPVVVGVERPKAVAYLLERYAVDIVLSDDGLQHYSLARDLEIAVIDGSRRFGNGYCLPAGPLREKPRRLDECDFVIGNGRVQAGEHAMQVSGQWLVALNNKHLVRPLAEFNGCTVHVVTAIGNPQRFLAQLTQAGIRCQPHLYPDHHLFAGTEFSFSDDLPVLMTEKDAVKCQAFNAQPMSHCWYLPVDARLEQTFEQAFLQRVAVLAAAKAQGGAPDRAPVTD